MMKIKVAMIIKLLILLAALLIVCSAYAEVEGGGSYNCNPKSDIVVKHTQTGKKVESKPEFEVTVTNNCGCALSQVVVKCFGLSAVTPIDETVIRPVDDENCILYDGKPIAKDSSIKFTYAWDTPQDFPFVKSKTVCS